MARRAWRLSGAVILTVVGLIPNSFIPRMTSFALADSLNAKPGAWDISITTQTDGSLIPPDLLAKMPPEQRAKFEQSMQARSGKPMTHNSKECVTQEDLDQDRMLKEQQEDSDLQCTTRVVSKSSSKLVIERTGRAQHLSLPPPR